MRKELNLKYAIIEHETGVELELSIPHSREEKFLIYTATAMDFVELYRKKHKLFSEDFNSFLQEMIHFLMLSIETIQIDIESERGFPTPSQEGLGDDHVLFLREIKELYQTSKNSKSSTKSKKKKNKSDDNNDNNDNNIEI